ncbi:MAG: SPOR domain-containing protein [Vicinamibacterales bacterium]
MATTTTDDGFHEIQLNGKQLVFLFMAVTVVSVVIFLCGVLVGRGVRGERGALTDVAAAEPGPDAASTPPIPATPGQGGASATANEKLTYPKQLEAPTPSDTLGAERAPRSTARVEPPTTPPPAKATSATEPPAATGVPAAKVTQKDTPPATTPAVATTGEPAGTGFAIQVAALRERSEADAVVRRLSGKGYSAYVVAPAGTASVYRVRVGKFKERREADSIAARLQKEEQFKPWIVR